VRVQQLRSVPFHFELLKTVTIESSETFVEDKQIPRDTIYGILSLSSINFYFGLS